VGLDIGNLTLLTVLPYAGLGWIVGFVIYLSFDLIGILSFRYHILQIFFGVVGSIHVKLPQAS